MKKRVKGTDDNTEFSRLRMKAEKLLSTNLNTSDHPKEIKDLFQELQVHQIELEMQNDELRLTNIELEKQRGRFSGIYNLAPVGYFVLDHTGVIKDINDTAMELLGINKKIAGGKRLLSFITANNSLDYYRFFAAVLNTGQVQKCTLGIKPLTGKTFYAQFAGVARTLADSPTECYIALIDITERINAERELAEIRDRLELSLKASLAGTWALDLKTMKVFLDESSQKICNVSAAGFSGDFEGFLKLIHPEDRQHAELQFRRSLKDHKEIDISCRFGKAGQTGCYTVIRGHMVPTGDPGDRFVGIILDITEKTQMEQSSSRLKEDYQRRIALAMINVEENERKRISESLHDSVSQLLYGIKIQLAQLEKKSPASANIKSVNKLLDQAIEETRNISFELAPSILTDFGLSATIEELVKRLSTKDLKMTASIKGFFKRMDLRLETNIYRIIQELVNNSMKHSGATQINIDISKNKFIEIIVKDNGKGYNITDQESSTTGSGISSIKNRLRIYNGSINVESEPDKGTTVRVRLDEDCSERK